MAQQKLISDTLWGRIQEAAKEIQDARTEFEKQESIRSMITILSRELEIDFGAAW